MAKYSYGKNTVNRAGAGRRVFKTLTGLFSKISPGNLFRGLLKLTPILIITLTLLISLFFLAAESGENTGRDRNLIDYGNRAGKTTIVTSTTSATGDDLVTEALKYVGNPYVWGGTSLTSGADCSGYTMSLLEKFGVSLPHNAAAQSELGEEVPLSDIKPGDLLFYTGSDGTMGHVTIYIGDGKVVHASNSRDGIKISDYTYRTPVKARRFLTAGTGENEYIEEPGIILSPANAAALSFYSDVSENKSSWQIFDETLATSTDAAWEDSIYIEDTSTGDILIRSDSPLAASDYFGNDRKFKISPYLLFWMNKYIWGDSFTYPEAFLLPVAHDGDYNLTPLLDDSRNVAVTSMGRDRDGKYLEKIPSTADYGIASVFKYRKETAEEVFKGTYIKEEYFDAESGTVKEREINIPYEIPLSSEERVVLDWALTFSGCVRFTYSPTVTLTDAVSEGESDEETDNVKKILYKEEKVSAYIVVPKANGEGTTAYAAKVICGFDEAREYCEKNPQYTLYGAEYEDRRIISAKTAEKTYKLYRYRSDDSGRYTNFAEVTSDASYGESSYLMDYLSDFDTYKPVGMRRDTEEFKRMDLSEDEKVSDMDDTSGDSGSFRSCWEDEVVRERIETIWDTAKVFGFSEEQASAAIGNWWYESGGRFDPDSVNAYSGAYGVCQWLGGRYSQLLTFSSEYFGEATPSFDAEIEFAMMELDNKRTYTWCSSQWLTGGHTQPRGTYSYADLSTYWDTSSDIGELTLAVCQGWERPGDTDGSLSQRTEFAEDCFAKLSGKSFGKALPMIESGSEASGTSEKTVTGESERYKQFYSEADGALDGRYPLQYVSVGLTTEKKREVLLLASSLARGEAVSEVRLDQGKELWEEGFTDYLLGDE